MMTIDMDMSVLFSIALNVVLMVLLGAVIFYARRLSESISVFRNSRKEMQSLIKELSQNVDKADDAIKSMRRETDTSADDLHFMITKAKALSEELQFIQESGERLANRLEKASESNGNRGYESSSFPSSHSASKPQQKEQKKKSAPPKPMFNIIDRELDTDGDMKAFLDDETDIPDNLKSQAERDLAKALQRQQEARKG